MASLGVENMLSVDDDTSSDEGGAEAPVAAPPASQRLSIAAKSALHKCLFENPNRMLLSLATEDASERRKSASVWIRDQKNHGRLLEVSERHEAACLCWMEDHRVGLVKEAFRELESLRSYRASADADIQRAVDWINAAASVRFSHH